MEKKTAIKNALENSMSYQAYLDLIEQLHLEEKATSFQENPEFYNYSKLGLKRMQRVFKTSRLNDQLIKRVESISQKQIWLLITESWCGDASQTVPIIAKLSELNQQIELRVVLRDSNEELMEYYLTDGGKSIPILAILNSDLNEIERWGPRPTEAQKKVKEYKALPDPKPPYSELSKDLQMWYNKDKGVSTQEELLERF